MQQMPKPTRVPRRIAQRILLDEGVPIALVPDTPDERGFADFFFKLAELVRNGIPEDQVLRAVTLTPAEILGIQARAGSLQAGKDADLLFFTGPPLAPTTALARVLVAGETVYEAKGGRP